MDFRASCSALLLSLFFSTVAFVGLQSAEFQYSHGEIEIPAASADEPKAKRFSIKQAARYVEDGAKAWAGKKDCISCHTTGSYLLYRPALTSHLGPPSRSMRDFFLSELDALRKTERKHFNSGTRTAQSVYIAAGLSEWDAHVTGKLSKETGSALRFMFELQQDNGAWQSLDCWPPFESSAYQEATVAAMAVATAPGWFESNADAGLKAKVGRLHGYLRDVAPSHDYARVLKLWTATRVPSLLPKAEIQSLMDVIWSHQRADGGWSIRSFGKPEQWGSGNRAKKLRAEPDFGDPSSDGHMTGLAVLVLRNAGVPASDGRLQKAVGWLKSNQRETGRWWTRSLNTDKFHFITYSGTLYPLLALMKCGELGQVGAP